MTLVSLGKGVIFLPLSTPKIVRVLYKLVSTGYSYEWAVDLIKKWCMVEKLYFCAGFLFSFIILDTKSLLCYGKGKKRVKLGEYEKLEV